MFAAGPADLGVYAVAVAATVNDLDHVVRNAATDPVGANVDRLGRKPDRSLQAGAVDRHPAPCRASTAWHTWSLDPSQ